ncbi:disease resistance protein RPV1-like [Syzygium oleosum]|uniref:disease resistance protein RPV1-like n=1 Tax=Syzygium oleosum TaxID=219896 RepID=UPI0024B90FC1|nr:disease resistance protein RPV1-like [Syzygium oleosum]
MYMWENCGLYPSQGIEELKLRCLIKIGDYGRFEMHDQLRDLGRSIFCQGQLPEKRSGPWDDDYEGVTRVLRECRNPWFRDWMQATSSGDSNELLSEIRWLQWQIMGSKAPLPTTNLHLPKLSVLDLSHSWGITEDWEGWSLITTAKRLQVLDLGWCEGLRCTPDLSAFTQLKILPLSGCFDLEHLHPSVGKLKSLVSLDLSECRRLKELPEEVGELKGLEELVLDDSGITAIPTSIGSLRKLKKLHAGGCRSLREIPSSIGDLRNLQHLDLSGFGIEKLPSAIGDLSSLQRLELWGDKLRSLPQLSSLIHLEKLRLRECHLLEDIPELPSRLLELYIKGCGKLILLKLDGLKNLEELSIGHDNLEFLEDIVIYNSNSIERLLCPESRCLKKLEAVRCDNLVEIQGLDGAKFLERLDFTGCESMEMLQNLTRCQKLRSLIVRDCKKLTQLQGLEKLDLIDLDISGCDSLEAIPKLSGTRIIRNYERELSYSLWKHYHTMIMM